MKDRGSPPKEGKVCAPRSAYYKKASSHMFTTRVRLNPNGVDFRGEPVAQGEPVSICSWCGRQQ